MAIFKGKCMLNTSYFSDTIIMLKMYIIFPEWQS